jgi:hypothetical protein
MKLHSIITIATLFLLSVQLYSADYFYRITVNNLQENEFYEYYVKSDLDFKELQDKCNDGKFIYFPVVYAWNGDKGAWGTWTEWDHLYTNELAVRGSEIMVIHKLKMDPMLRKKDSVNDDINKLKISPGTDF